MLTIREAVIADLPALLNIYNHAVRTSTATFDLEEQTLEQRSEWFAAYGGKYPLLAAEWAGRVVGYGTLSVFRTKKAFDSTVELSIYVDAEHWGMGIGRKIMSEMIVRAASGGFHSIVSGITSDNATSIHMHETTGFRQVGLFREVGYKFGGYLDLYFYELLLNQIDQTGNTK